MGKLFTGKRIAFPAFIAAWTVWFTVKILLGRFVLHQDVIGDISGRIALATRSSSELLLTAATFLRFLLLTIFRWTDVFLPFIQDSLFVLRTYLYPFTRERVVGPLLGWLSPVPLLIWRVWMRFNETVPLEYRCALLCFGALALSKRLNPFVKSFFSVFLGILVTYRWISPLLALSSIKLAVFVILPASLVVHAVTDPRSNVSPERQSNILVYLSVAPVLILLESKLSFMSGPIINVASTPAMYALFGSWLFWIDNDHPSRVFRTIVNRAGFVPVLKPLFERIGFFLRARFPILARMEEKWRSLSFNAVALSALTSENRGIVYKTIAFLKSTPLLAVLCIAGIGVLGLLYWVHSVASSVFIIGLWPWWTIDTVKVWLYDRKEDYRGQLAFSLLFVGLELFLIKQQTGFVPFVLNIFHLPIILVLKLMPLVIIRLVTKTLTLVPQLGLGIAAKRLQKRPAAPPLEQSSDESATALVEKPTRRKSSSTVKRRSVAEK
jgi:hypothetical protein